VNPRRMTINKTGKINRIPARSIKDIATPLESPKFLGLTAVAERTDVSLLDIFIKVGFLFF
jgi:superfamily II DNA or RNA helicase